jgi:hypothetical protein
LTAAASCTFNHEEANQQARFRDRNDEPGSVDHEEMTVSIG